MIKLFHRSSTTKVVFCLFGMSSILLATNKKVAVAAADVGAPPADESLSALPIRTDLKQAIRLGVWALSNSFDRDRNDEPYFYANHRADGTGEFHHALEIGAPHVVGRCLWASMLAEETTGTPFPPEALAILTRYCKESFDNEDHLNSYLDPKANNQRFIIFHNMREGLLGLLALAKGRELQWAKSKADLMIGTLEKLTDFRGHLSMELAKEVGMASRCKGIGCDATTSGRLVGPLVEYYRFSQDSRALKLAELYARATLETAFRADGRFAPMKTSGGHLHSITSSLSGITMYAVFAKDAKMLDRCRQIVDRGVPEYFSSWGWGDEVMPEHPANVVSRGEINQTGDIIRTALLLGESGLPEYYELAERFLRSMLLPTQHREEELKRFLKENPDPKGDFERDVLNRIIGGYSMQLPNDRMRKGDWPLSTLDITSGAVHALCECWRHRATSDDRSVRLNLLFDIANDDVEISSGLPIKGEIRFVAKSPRTLWIRMPGWVDRQTIRLLVQGEERKIEIEKGYLKIGGLQSRYGGLVQFKVPHKKEKEVVDGVEYTTKWIGNQIVEINPRGKVSPLPF